MKRYFVGLDLGTMRDYSALSVVEKQPPPPEERKLQRVVLQREPKKPPPALYNALNLHRYPLQTSYPDLVKAVTAVLATPPLRGNSVLVIDSTGVGLPVAQLFRATGVPLIMVTITGGHHVNVEGGSWHVPKRVLVSTLKMLTGCRRLRTAPGPYRDIIDQELLNFELTVTEAANDTYAGRAGQHDDLVLSVAMAAWWGERYREPEPSRSCSFWTGW